MTLNSLHVALMIKNSEANRQRSNRAMGYWSYPVKEFTWAHFALAENQSIDMVDMAAKGFDLVLHEDVGIPVGYRHRPIPLAYLAIDSTLSEQHYQSRLPIARQADLVLVDHDDLSRWPNRVRRLGYCVNDLIFKPAAHKTLDIAYHCSSSGQRGLPGAETRTMLRQYLHEYAQSRGYSYQSGAKGLLDYAANIARTKVNINWPRVRANRPHRVLDTLACNTCLVTGQIPRVAEDMLEPLVHYYPVEHFDQLGSCLDFIFDNGDYQSIATRGYELAKANHTWATRAGQLRQIIFEELGI